MKLTILVTPSPVYTVQSSLERRYTHPYIMYRYMEF